MGSVFVALADRWLEVEGRLAFVLPAALASGEAWSATRDLLSKRYHLETVIASHDAERQNFSENTGLSELLFVARKLKAKEKSGATTYINLWRNPRSIHEALDLANRITHVTTIASVTGKGITSIPSHSGKLGEMISTPAPKGEGNWIGALFAQAELLRVCWSLQTGSLNIPGSSKTQTIPICALGDIGELGYDRRDIHDAFEMSADDWSPYASFWNHEADKVRTIAQKPTSHLLARTVAAKGRKMKDATAVWSKAGRILLVERLRSNTHRVLAIGFQEPVLGNTWWAFKPHTKLSVSQEKALLLWLNGSLSLLLFFSRRVITEGAWMQMKKPAWTAMPVLDVRSLSEAQIAALSASYDLIRRKALEPLASLNSDSTRREIDEALAEALKLPDLTPVRQLLAREPGLNAKDINTHTDEDEDDEDE